MISTAEFQTLFPFGIHLNQHLQIVLLGRSLGKWVTVTPGAPFGDFFEILRNSKPVSIDLLHSLSNSPIQLGIRGSALILIGQFASASDGFLFLGSPKVESVNDLSRLGLQINDFAPHDLVMTSLFHLQRTEIVANESIASAQDLARQQHIYRQIVEQSNDLIVALEAEGLLTIANPRATELLGIRPGTTTANEFLPPAARRTWEAAAALLRDGQRSAGVELTLLGSDGEEVLVEGHLVLSVTEEDRRPVLAFLRDVTLRKLAERELAASHEKLRQAQKMEAIGRFAGGIAHDFNNLLGVISGAASLLQEDLEPDNAHRPDVELILSSSEKGSALAHQILQFSNRSPAAQGQTDLVAQTRTLCPMLERVLGPQIELSFTALVESIAVDIAPIQYEQILLNLAVNAGHAMPKGGAFEIRVERTADSQSAQLEVKDSGSGMSTNVLQHIFEPFYSTKPTGSGTGLGLSVVYGIIDDADGEILVESELKKGTRFTITLPAGAGLRPQKQKKLAPPATLGVIPGAKRAIVLEDVPELRRLTTRALERMGLTVTSFDSIEATKKGFATFDGIPDIFVTDVSLPDGNGLDLAEHLAQEGRVKAVVVTTGNADFERIKTLIGIHGWHMLMKPFRMQHLSELIKSILAGPDGSSGACASGTTSPSSNPGVRIADQNPEEGPH